MNDSKRQTGSVSAIALPLRGKTVLITRPKEQADEFSRLLTDRGANTVFIPTIEIVPPTSWQQCDNAIDAIGKYDGIIFTSTNAVRAFFGRIRERHSTSITAQAGKMVYHVVGTATGDALVDEGFTPCFFPDVNNSRQLAEALAKTPLHGKRLLFPKGNLASDDPAELLRSAGAIVDEAAVYDTVAPRDADGRAIREKLQRDPIDIVTFFSPSSVRHLVSMIPRELIASKTIAVIGKSTAAAAEEAGLHVHILSGRPTSAALVDAIVHYHQTIERGLL